MKVRCGTPAGRRSLVIRYLEIFFDRLQISNGFKTEFWLKSFDIKRTCKKPKPAEPVNNITARLGIPKRKTMMIKLAAVVAKNQNTGLSHEGLSCTLLSYFLVYFHLVFKRETRSNKCFVKLFSSAQSILVCVD